MEIRKFVREFLTATKKVLRVLNNPDEQDPTGLANTLKLDFPQLRLQDAGLRECSGFARVVPMSIRQMLFYMEAARTGTKRLISTGNVQVLLNLMSAMSVKQQPAQAVSQPQVQVLP